MVSFVEPVPTWLFVDWSNTTALMWLKCVGRKALLVSALRSNSAEKEKLAGLREKSVSGEPVPLSRGLVDAKLKSGTRGIVKTSTTIILKQPSVPKLSRVTLPLTCRSE